MRFRRVGHLASKGKIRNTHIFLFRKPEIMGQLGRNSWRWVENINTVIQKIEQGARKVD
jgi:hypothetical protein